MPRDPRHPGRRLCESPSRVCPLRRWLRRDSSAGSKRGSGEGSLSSPRDTRAWVSPEALSVPVTATPSLLPCDDLIQGVGVPGGQDFPGAQPDSLLHVASRGGRGQGWARGHGGLSPGQLLTPHPIAGVLCARGRSHQVLGAQGGDATGCGHREARPEPFRASHSLVKNTLLHVPDTTTRRHTQRQPSWGRGGSSPGAAHAPCPTSEAPAA